MSKLLYDYLSESPLFEERHLENNFEGVSDAQLLKDLRSYRQYVLDQLPSIYSEASQDSDKMTATMEGIDSYRPAEAFLKQCSLYIDTVMIDDPLFKMVPMESSVGEALNKYLGFDNKELDREKIVEAIRYMMRITPGVVSDFIKFIPLSYLHEPPKEIPISISKNYFADILSEDLLQWFRNRASVKSLKKVHNGWQIENSLYPSRGISIEFINHLSKGSMYQLFQRVAGEIDKQTGKAVFRLELPDEVPEKNYFDAWVFQSINQAAKHTYEQIVSEARNASILKSSYLTRSPFTVDLLNLLVGQQTSLRADLANLVLQLDLPVINSASFADLINIRQNEGVAFSNFRIELGRQLRELRVNTEPEKVKLKLDNIAQDLEEVQLNEVRKKVEKLKRSAMGDFLVVTASLGAAYFGYSALASSFGVGWGANQLRTRYTEYASEVKESPAYFLWKVKNG